jgi:hypothetical protein
VLTLLIRLVTGVSSLGHRPALVQEARWQLPEKNAANGDRQYIYLGFGGALPRHQSALSSLHNHTANPPTKKNATTLAHIGTTNVSTVTVTWSAKRARWTIDTSVKKISVTV